MSNQHENLQRVPRLVGLLIICVLAGYALAQAPEPVAPEPAAAQTPATETPAPETPAPETSEAEDTEPDAAEAPTLDEKLDALLSETLSVDEYGESRHCLHRSAYRRVEIINQEFLLFSKRGTYYLNRLKRKCPGLRRKLLLTFRMMSNSVCKSDIVYASDRSGSFYQATCHLGEFELIGEEHALALKAAL